MNFSSSTKSQSVQMLDCEEYPEIDKFNDYNGFYSSFTFPNTKIIFNQTKNRKKTIPLENKYRKNTLFKLIKNRQNTMDLTTSRISISYFTEIEDQILAKLVSERGPKFKEISKYFPGKTFNMVKNRYYKFFRGQISQNLTCQQPEQNINNSKTCVDELIEESPLFPQLRNQLNRFFRDFEQEIEEWQSL